MKRVVFDLDGTLLDSLPDIAGAVNGTLADEGVAPLPQATIGGFVGKGLPNLVARVISETGLPEAEHARLTAEVLKRYESAVGLTRPYPGVEAALDRLAGAGLALSVCTNKPDSATRAVLAAMGWADRFDIVVGGDTLAAKKPDPAPLFAALGDTPVDLALYVGDSETDAATAQAAGIRFALFSGGYRKSPVEAIPHDDVFDGFDALPDLAIVRA